MNIHFVIKLSLVQNEFAYVKVYRYFSVTFVSFTLKNILYHTPYKFMKSNAWLFYQNYRMLNYEENYVGLSTTEEQPIIFFQEKAFPINANYANNVKFSLNKDICAWLTEKHQHSIKFFIILLKFYIYYMSFNLFPFLKILFYRSITESSIPKS